MKKLMTCLVFSIVMTIGFVLSPSCGSATPPTTPQALSNDCINVEVRQFYPGQSGSEMYYLTNHCGVNINLDFATKGMPTQLVQLDDGMGRFTGWSGHVPAPYKFWYCEIPRFPSDPNKNPQDGPGYDAEKVVCRQ